MLATEESLEKTEAKLASSESYVSTTVFVGNATFILVLLAML